MPFPLKIRDGVFVIWVLAFWSQVTGAVELQKVILYKDLAPGTNGRRFFSFDQDGTPLNSHGDSAYKASLCCPSPGILAGIWVGQPETLSLVVLDRSQALGFEDGVLINDLAEPVINDSSEIVFSSGLSGPGISHLIGPNGNNGAIWRRSSGSLQALAQKNSPVPAMSPDVVFTFFEDRLQLNDAGTMVFSGNFGGGAVDMTRNTGIWRSENGFVSKVAYAGDEATGLPSGVRLKRVQAGELSNNDALTYFAELEGPGIAANNSSSWVEYNGVSRLIVQAGMEAPGTPAGTVFSSGTSSTINGNGQIAFRHSLSGPNIDSSNDRGIWIENEGVMELVARAGDPAPGTTSNTVFTRSFSNPLLNDLGQIVFSTGLVGPSVTSSTDAGTWLVDDGTSILVARKGSEATGLAPGTAYSSIGPAGFNNNSTIVFNAAYAGTEVGNGVWVRKRRGDPHLLVKRGQLIDVNNSSLIDDFRVVSDVSAVQLSDSDHILLDIRFTDFSFGYFLADVSRVPEPNLLLPMVIAFNCILVSRRHWIKTSISGVR